jgi:hypothetical protein
MSKPLLLGTVRFKVLLPSRETHNNKRRRRDSSRPRLQMSTGANPLWNTSSGARGVSREARRYDTSDAEAVRRTSLTRERPAGTVSQRVQPPRESRGRSVVIRVIRRRALNCGGREPHETLTSTAVRQRVLGGPRHPRIPRRNSPRREDPWGSVCTIETHATCEDESARDSTRPHVERRNVLGVKRSPARRGRSLER